MGTRCADHVTPLYPQMLALTSPTGGGSSVGIVRVRTKATEFSFSFSLWYHILNIQIVHSEKIQLGVCVYNCREELNSKINKSEFDYLCADSRVQACALCLF